MGGPGSGSHYHWWRSGKKTTVEECLSIDANSCMRKGVLKAGRHTAGNLQWTYRNGRGFTVNFAGDTRDPGDPFLRLWYAWAGTSTRDQGSADYAIRLTTTRPRFGGLRWWFSCPLVRNGRPCGRRVGKLYLPGRARYFGCRHCYQLTYTSCQESRKYDGLYRLMARNLGCDFATAKRAMNSIGKRR
jgi:hypothetical protein